jgi:hypothetical protein
MPDFTQCHSLLKSTSPQSKSNNSMSDSALVKSINSKKQLEEAVSGLFNFLPRSRLRAHCIVDQLWKICLRRFRGNMVCRVVSLDDPFKPIDRSS